MDITSVSLRVPYHQQNNDDYCGPACVRMVIGFFGKSLLNSPNYQFTLHNSIIHIGKVLETEMVAGPKGLAKALNCNNPDPTKFSYVCVTSQSASALSEYIAQQIEQYQTPALALVYGKAHWVVVSGFKRKGGNLDGFMIHNPWPPIGNIYSDEEGFPSHDLTPHKCGDGRVPVNGIEDAPPPSVDRGAAYNHVSYDGWVCDYWQNRYPSQGSAPWAGRYVAVCPGAPTGIVEACYDRLDNTQIVKLPDPADNAYSLSGTTITTDLEAAQAALQGMLDHGLQHEDPWVDALAGQDPANPRVDRVHSVNYAHKPGRYYLVWFTAAKSGQLSVCARVDADSGKYIESVAVPAGAGAAATPIDPGGHEYQAYVQRIASQTASPNSSLSVALYSDEAVPQPDNLPYATLPSEVVWQPCDQSASSFYPFYSYNYTDAQERPCKLYVRTQDGTPFYQLTTNIVGQDDSQDKSE